MEVCPHCGEELKPGALSCRSCGSDAATGWKEDLDYYSVELPEDPPSKRYRERNMLTRILLGILAAAIISPIVFWVIGLPGGKELAIALGPVPVGQPILRRGRL